MNIALSKANYLPSHTCSISTNNLPTFLVSSKPGCVRGVSYFHGMSTVGFKETEFQCSWYGMPVNFFTPTGFMPGLLLLRTRSCKATSFPGRSSMRNTVMSLRKIGGQDVIASLSRSQSFKVEGSGKEDPLPKSNNQAFSFAVVAILSSAVGWRGIPIFDAANAQATSPCFLREMFKPHWRQ